MGNTFRIQSHWASALNSFPKTSGNPSLQLSHPLEKLSAACPVVFRRGWRETFKAIPHPPSLTSRPSILRPNIPTSVPLYPSMDPVNEAPSWKEEETVIWIYSQFVCFHSYVLFQQIITHNNSSINLIISYLEGGKKESRERGDDNTGSNSEHAHTPTDF